MRPVLPGNDSKKVREQGVKRKIIILTQEYPQISETYIKNEIDVLAEEFEVEILAMSAGNFPYRSRRPHIVVTKQNIDNVVGYLKDFGACAVHGHYLNIAPQAEVFSRALNIPYTIRTHSFDILNQNVDRVNSFAKHINSDLCLGALTFPCTVEHLLKAGVRSDKIHSCFPVVDVQRFHNQDINGDAIMNVGAAIPKKNMESYIALSKLLPDRTFDLYAMGYHVNSLKQVNRKTGGAVNFIPPVKPEEMPPEYKKHEWLVYTAASAGQMVGWPMAIAEAQASGVGVLMANIRPDLKEYVGNAGYLFDTIEEAAEILRTPFPNEMRQRGFSLAKRSDIRSHISQLTDLWP